MSLKDVDILEILDRYNFVAENYVKLAIELAPMLEKFGKYKKELELLTVEFVEREVVIKDRDDLEDLIKKEIEKRRNKANVEENSSDSGP
jgi:hypothetical protein